MSHIQPHSKFCQCCALFPPTLAQASSLLTCIPPIGFYPWASCPHTCFHAGFDAECISDTFYLLDQIMLTPVQTSLMLPISAWNPNTLSCPWPSKPNMIRLLTASLTNVQSHAPSILLSFPAAGPLFWSQWNYFLASSVTYQDLCSWGSLHWHTLLLDIPKAYPSFPWNLLSKVSLFLGSPFDPILQLHKSPPSLSLSMP